MAEDVIGDRLSMVIAQQVVDLVNSVLMVRGIHGGENVPDDVMTDIGRGLLIALNAMSDEAGIGHAELARALHAYAGGFDNHRVAKLDIYLEAIMAARLMSTLAGEEASDGVKLGFIDGLVSRALGLLGPDTVVTRYAMSAEEIMATLERRLEQTEHTLFEGDSVWQDADREGTVVIIDTDTKRVQIDWIDGRKTPYSEVPCEHIRWCNDRWEFIRPFDKEWDEAE